MPGLGVGQGKYGLSLWFGTALIVVGVVVNFSAARQHVRIVHALARGHEARGTPLAHTVTIAVFLGLVGLAMAIYLISVRGS